MPMSVAMVFIFNLCRGVTPPCRAFGVVWFVVCLLVLCTFLCYIHVPPYAIVLCKKEQECTPPQALMWSSSPSSEQTPFPTVLLVSFGLLFTCWSFMPSYVAYVLPLALMCCVGRKVKSDKDHHPPPLAGSLSPSNEQPHVPYCSFGVVWFVVCLLVFPTLLCYVHAPLCIVVLCKEEW